MGRCATWGNFGGRTGARAEQAGGVALIDDKIRERGGETARVIELAAVLKGEAHRAAEIEDDVTAEVRFRLEFLEIEAVGAAEDAPVQAADVVAGDVVAILGELDAGAAM